MIRTGLRLDFDLLLVFVEEEELGSVLHVNRGFNLRTYVAVDTGVLVAAVADAVTIQAWRQPSTARLHCDKVLLLTVGHIEQQ